MVSLKDYREQVKEELENEEIPDCKILMAYETNNLTEAVYKLMDILEKKEVLRAEQLKLFMDRIAKKEK